MRKRRKLALQCLAGFKHIRCEQAIADKLIPGFAEEMRRSGLAQTPRAILSRGIAAIRGTTLLLNLPGSPKGAVQSLDAVAALLPHAIQIIHGAKHD